MRIPSAIFTGKRRMWERLLVVAALALVLSFGFVEGWFFEIRSDLPLLGNLFLLAFTNINVLLLLLLAYLVLRNVVKLIFERRRDILGSRLKTRLVVASVCLTLITAVPLFWLASRFIFSNLDHWFSAQVRQSLEDSVDLAKRYVESEQANLVSHCMSLLPEISSAVSAQGTGGYSAADSGKLIERNRISALYVYDSSDSIKWVVKQDSVPQIEPDALRRSFKGGRETSSKLIDITEKIYAVAALLSLPGSSSQTGGDILIAVRLIPPQLARKLRSISDGYENYFQVQMLHVPLKNTHFITFVIVTLLAMFAAVWFGFYLAKNLTQPIQTLVAATRRIADGDLDVRLDSGRNDEIGMLMESFNNMTSDLRESRQKLDSAYNALQSTNVELDGRRRYMEIVLTNIAAGVVSVDAAGHITTMNNSAETMFGVRAEDVKGKHYSEFIDQSHMEIIQSFVNSCREGGQPFIERQIYLKVAGTPVSIFVKVSVLRDELDQYMGLVVVLDDFTELEKAQRMAAWREVARRIAHEIKNPLTPIQLSAQRLRRKYGWLMGKPPLLEKADMDGSIFDECTRTIVQQVDHMKHLVNEFSRFARLPRARLAACDLSEIIEEGLSLYRHNFNRITFRMEKDESMPQLRLDRDQFRQVIINLLENSVQALESREGRITIRLSHDPELKIARLECADTGHGIAPENMRKVFEPYYSTRDKGTGLGLAIVSSIIADHNGFIRVRANNPRGTVVTIELPG